MGRRPKGQDTKTWRILCSDGKPYHTVYQFRDNADKMRIILDYQNPFCGPHKLQISDKRGRSFHDELPNEGE